MTDRKPFNPGDDPIPELLRDIMNDIGKIVASAIAEKAGKPMGFVLLAFDFGPGGTMSYISNADREDVLNALNEFITRNAQ